MEAAVDPSVRLLAVGSKHPYSLISERWKVTDEKHRTPVANVMCNHLRDNAPAGDSRHFPCALAIDVHLQMLPRIVRPTIKLEYVS